jgi:hypothetical protein
LILKAGATTPRSLQHLSPAPVGARP